MKGEFDREVYWLEKNLDEIKLRTWLQEMEESKLKVFDGEDEKYKEAANYS